MGRFRRIPLGGMGRVHPRGKPFGGAGGAGGQRPCPLHSPEQVFGKDPLRGVWGEYTLGGDPSGVWGEGGDPWGEYTLKGDPATNSSAMPSVSLNTSTTDGGGPSLSEVSEDITITLLGVSPGPHPCTPESVPPLVRGGGALSLNLGGVTDQGHSG